MPDNASILPGQVWADRQSGQEGRTVEVLADPPKSNYQVRIQTLTPTEFSKSIDGGKRSVGRKSTLSVATLRKNYRFDQAATDALAAERAHAAEIEASGGIDSYQHAQAARLLLDGQQVLRDLSTVGRRHEQGYRIDIECSGDSVRVLLGWDFNGRGYREATEGTGATISEAMRMAVADMEAR
jgi:hypothetical protein